MEIPFIALLPAPGGILTGNLTTIIVIYMQAGVDRNEAPDIASIPWLLRFPSGCNVGQTGTVAESQQIHTSVTLSRQSPKITGDRHGRQYVIYIAIETPVLHEREIGRLFGNQRPGQIDLPHVDTVYRQVQERRRLRSGGVGTGMEINVSEIL